MIKIISFLIRGFDNIWIGISDIDMEGTLKWENTWKTQSKETNKINSRVVGNTEFNDCVSMKKDRGYLLTLEPCSEMNNFVCEAPGKSNFVFTCVHHFFKYSIPLINHLI